MDVNEPTNLAEVNRKILKEAQRRFRFACQAEEDQRKRERDDLRFQVAELQWDETARLQREGKNVAGLESPARPVLSVSKIEQPIQLVNNQMKAAHLGVNIHPVNEQANQETAEVQEDLYRRIERDSNAAGARNWAYDRAVKVGFGCYRVGTKYDEESGDSFDQEITIDRILFQDCVHFDPEATKPDFSDARYAFVTSWMSLERFKAEYPKARMSAATALEWEGYQQDAPEWLHGQTDAQAVLVAEYWRREIQAETLCLLHDGTIVPKESLPTGAHVKAERSRETPVVTFYKICGTEVLECQEWMGRYIPLIAVLGRELQPIDGERRLEGMIRPARDAQRLFNFGISTLVERMASEPKTPWVMAEGQDENHEEEWRRANILNLPVLKYKPTTTKDGTPAPPPQRAQLDSSGVSLSLMVVQEADQLVQTATSVYDPSLGKLTQKERSGRAILATQSQSDAATSNYLGNLADAMRYEALVVVDLMPHVYDRPERVAQVLGADTKTTRAVMLNAPHVMDPRTGQPVAVPNGTMGAKNYSLDGRYTVSIDIGKSFQTRLEEGGEQIGQIIESDPTLLPVIGDLYFRFRDIPGAQEIADRIVKWRQKLPQFAGIDEQDDQGVAERAQAENQQLKQQCMALQAQVQELGQKQATDEAKQQATVISKQIDLQIARENNATKLAVARITATKGAAGDMLEVEEEAIALRQTQAFEASQAEADRQHESQMAAQANAHEAAMAAASPVPGGNGLDQAAVPQADGAGA